MIIIALGSNKPFCGQPPADIVRKALDAITSLGQEPRVSPLYESPAWPDPAEPPYVNAVTTLECSPHSPEALLAALHAIEDAFGRERAYLDNPALRYAARTLDLDLLAYGDVTRGAEQPTGLVLPHPAMAERDFVLLPLADILVGDGKDWRHPETGLSIEDMLAKLPSMTAKRLGEEQTGN